MNSSLEVSRAATGRRIRSATTRVRLESPGRAAERDEGPWRVAGSLVLIAFGITFGVALARLHYGLGGEASADGLSQGFVLKLYESFGFASSFYFFLLVTIWGLLAFFGSSVRAALRRLAVAVVFVASFASLSALMGGNGGDFGSWVAERLQSGIGSAVTFLILGLMSVMSLLLATDWFFFARFRAMLTAPAASARTRASANAATETSSVAFRPEEITGEKLRPVPVPVSPRARVFEQAKTEAQDARLREQELVDRVLEEARLELSGSSNEFSGASASAVLAPPAETETIDSVDAEPSEDDVEARRLALRARREAARVAREEAALFGHGATAGVVDEDRAAFEVSEEDADGEGVATVDAVDHVDFVDIVDIVDKVDGVDVVDAPDAYHNDGLHPDEELGLAGLLEDPEPFADLDNDDLLAKAGEALEKQWQSGGVGFSKELGERAAPADAERADAERADADRVEPPLVDSSDEDGQDRSSEERDPFLAEPDRALRASSPNVLDRESLFGSCGPDASPEESRLSPSAGGEQDGDVRDGDDAQDEDDEKPIVIEPVPSRRPMPEDAPVEEPAPAQPTDARQQVLFDVGGEQDGEIERRLDEAAELVLTARRPTPSLLQRRMGVDGVAARRLLDRLAVLGAVAEPADGGPWHPLVSFDDWASRAR